MLKVSLLSIICNGIEQNVLVLFPSYSTLLRFIKTLKITRNQFVEQRGERQANIMKKLYQFKREGGVFLSVMGGKLSEGVDFPSDELEVVIIVGIPYPPPTAKLISLQRFYDETYGNGWKYVVETQAIRRVLQSIGRLIRSENDRGVAIILDERAKRLTAYLPLNKTKNVEEDIRRFFEKKKLNDP